MLTVKVNGKPVQVPDNATGVEVCQAAVEAGITARRQGAGGEHQLRGEHEPSGGMVLITAHMPINNWSPPGARWKYSFRSFRLSNVEPSNMLRWGAHNYWPASPGLMNVHQIRAAISQASGMYRCYWNMPRIHKAASILKHYGYDNLPEWHWNPDAPPVVRGQGGMLCDHSGKRSVSRATSLLATLTLCGVALIGQIGDKGEPSIELLGILAAVALGPIGLNRYFGESGAKFLTVGGHKE